MKFEQDLRLASTIAILKGQQFRYSTTDCNALVARCVDAILGTNTWNELIRDKYHTGLAARRFQMRVDPTRYLLSMGFNVLSLDGGLQNGDVVLVQEKNFVCGHICFGGMLWSSSPKYGVSAYEINIPDNAIAYRLGE
jgi:hypothetical protein